jgi:hypothetical protein
MYIFILSSKVYTLIKYLATLIYLIRFRNLDTN